MKALDEVPDIHKFIHYNVTNDRKLKMKKKLIAFALSCA